MPTIILGDDHHLVRQGLRVLLNAEPELEVVGEAADGVAVLELVGQIQPDLLIVDLMMPGMNGLEVTRQIRQRAPGTAIIILSMHAAEPYVLEALRSGAGGYVLKESSADELVRAVREVLAGRRYLSPPLTERAIDSYINQAQEMALDLYDTLTQREREVLNLAAEGLNNAEIAQRLSISPRTAETHRGNLMRKLELHNQVDLIKYALKRGLIPLDE